MATQSEAALEPTTNRRGEENHTPVPAILDPQRMDLTSEECDQAWEIRRAIEAMPEMENLSDFMYCQLAIVAANNKEEALERALHLQCFREDFKVPDTLSHGLASLKKLLSLAPAHFMALHFQDDAYSLFLNIKGFETSVLNTREKEEEWIVGYYYLQHALSCDFETIRQGLIIHQECGGYDWKKHCSPKLFKRLCDAFHSSYPFRYSAKHYHTGTMFNTACAMTRKLYPEGLIGCTQVGCVAPLPLDEIYLQPSVEIASERCLLQLQTGLKRRFQMEREFSLEAFSAKPPPEDPEDEGES
jgi:hypothetical protein